MPKEIVLKIENLQKSYAADVLVLKGINLEVTKGDFFALLGANGAGKTTTIGILASLIRKSAGKVEICGINIDQDFARAKMHLGIMPQEFNLNNWNTLEHILSTQAGYYGITGDYAKQRIEECLKMVDLWQQRDVKALKLSGGMKRRLMLARALVHEPDILILDEPTAGVDIHLRRKIWEVMKTLNKKKKTTIILTTHYLEEAEQLCKKVAILHQGEIVHQSSMAQLLNKIKKAEFLVTTKDTLDIAPVISGCQTRLIDENGFIVTISTDQGINHVFNQLDEQKIEVLGIRERHSRLEELFVEITSRDKS